MTSTDMAHLAGSLQDIVSWATAEFREYFDAIRSFSTYRNIPTYEFNGKFIDGELVHQTIQVCALPIGSTIRKDVVYARFIGDHEFNMFSQSTVISWKDDDEVRKYIKPVLALSEVRLWEPFEYVVNTKHPDSVDRLETLIRYYFLRGGDKDAVGSDLEFFKKHFRAACRDVARATGAVTEDDEMDDDTLPDDPPPDSIAGPDEVNLCASPTPTSFSDTQIDEMNERYYDFKTSLMKQLGAMQKTDKHNMVQLQAQNSELQRKLTLAEEKGSALSKELDVEQTKTKTATEEAATWKAQYEGLKETLQGVLSQRF